MDPCVRKSSLPAKMNAAVKKEPTDTMPSTVSEGTNKLFSPPIPPCPIPQLPKILSPLSPLSSSSNESFVLPTIPKPVTPRICLPSTSFSNKNSCMYILKRGPMKGKPCRKNCKDPNSSFCRLHTKGMTTPSSARESTLPHPPHAVVAYPKLRIKRLKRFKKYQYCFSLSNRNIVVEDERKVQFKIRLPKDMLSRPLNRDMFLIKKFNSEGKLRTYLM